MRAIQKITSGELLTKQSMRKNVLYTKNMYILKLEECCLLGCGAV
jgi:hypothetical protein